MAAVQPISRAQLMWQAFWRVLLVTVVPLVFDALLHGLDVVQGEPAFADVWWVAVIAPVLASLLRRFVPQPVDSPNVGVVDTRQRKTDGFFSNE
jgi:Na+/H+-dicarboxylate symporter